VAAISGKDTTVILDKSTDFLFKSDDISCPVDANGDRQCVCPFFGGCGGIDTDGDGLEDTRDICPTVVNSGVDADGDGVDDACDTCLGDFNPQFIGTVSPGGGGAINAAFTLTSGQRDDDGDGIGNKCDFKYGNAGTFISPLDVSDMRNSTASLVFNATCGTSGAKRCAQFDHDSAGVVVAPADVSALRGRVATLNGPSYCGRSDTACAVGGAFSTSNLGTLVFVNVGQAVQCGSIPGTTCQYLYRWRGLPTYRSGARLQLESCTEGFFTQKMLDTPLGIVRQSWG
jgi:hypothetical protein